MNLSNFLKTVYDKAFIKTFSTNTTLDYSDGNVQILKPNNDNLELELPNTIKSRIMVLFNESNNSIKLKMDDNTDEIILKPNYFYRLVADINHWNVVESEELDQYTLSGSNNLATRQNIFSTYYTQSISMVYGEYNLEKYVIIAYSDGNDGGKGKAVLGKIVSGEIELGNTFTFNNVNTDNISIELLSNQKIMIAYRDIDNSKGCIIAASLNVTSSTIDFHNISSYTVDFFPTDIDKIKTATINDHIMAIIMVDQTTGYGNIIIASLAINYTIAINSPTIFNHDSTGDIAICHITSGKTIIGYYNSTSKLGYIRLVNIIGSTCGLYQEHIFNQEPTDYISISKINDSTSRFVLGYQNGDVYKKGYMTAGVIVGTDLGLCNFNYELYDTEVSNINIKPVNAVDDMLMVAFSDINNAGYGVVITFKIDINNYFYFNDSFTFHENEVSKMSLVDCNNIYFRYILIAHQYDGLLKYGCVSIIS